MNKKYRVVEVDYAVFGIRVGDIVEAVPEDKYNQYMIDILDTYGRRTPQVIVYNRKGDQQSINAFCLEEIE